MKLTFAPALPEDVIPILEWNRELMHQYEDLTSIDYHRVIQWVESNIREHLPCFRRILTNETIAGYFCLCPEEDRWELDSLFVLEPFRNQGIGTEVLKHCIQRSGGNLFLYVFKANTGAIRLYERMGFHAVKEARKTAWVMEFKHNP